MGESTKAILGVGFLASFVTSGIFWIDDRPTLTTWVLRFAFLLSAVGCLMALILLQKRKDRAPDFLSLRFKNFFNSNGFCFAFRTEERHGIARLILEFQNQYDRDCIGVVSLMPAQGFFLNRDYAGGVMIPFDCPGGAFGSIEMKIAVPNRHQGKAIRYEVGATVEYPDGKGRRLRFKDGIYLRATAAHKDKFGKILRFGGLLVCGIIGMSPVTVNIAMPSAVSEDPQDDKKLRHKIHWSPPGL